MNSDSPALVENKQSKTTPRNGRVRPRRFLFVLLLISVLAVFGQAARADDVTVKISKVHLCCDSCVKGVDTAIAGVAGSKAVSDKATGEIVLTAPDHMTLQKAADALAKAGYFGQSSDATIKIDGTTGAKGEKVQNLNVAGVHLCCMKCVKAVTAAIKDVPGVTGNTAVKNAPSFAVTGDFKDSDVFDALQKAGLTGKVKE